MRRTITILGTAVVVLGVLTGIGQLLGRVDRANADARMAYEHASAMESRLVSLEQHANVITTSVSGQNAELAVCRQRTESLRAVLQVLIPSGIWPDLVRLPDPPPGWAAWERPGRSDGKNGDLAGGAR